MTIESLQAALDAGPTSAFYTHPRDDNKWKENEAFALACDPDTIRALLADALRYRWLEERAHKGFEMFTLPPVWFVPKLSFKAQTLRAALDAAMQQEKP